MGGEVLHHTVIAGGVVLGFFSAVLPLGPVTVLVVHRALAGDPVGALRFGLGRVPPEMVYCALATFGTVALLDRFTWVRTGVEVSAIVLFVAVGGWLAAGKTALSGAEAAAEAAADVVESRRNRWGFTAGLIVGVLNPQYLFSWTAIVAIAVSVAGLQPTMVDKAVFPFAAASGVSLGYVLLVRLMRRHRERLTGPRVQWVLRGLGVLLIALALWKVVQLVDG